ncbi:CHAT domain-containing protein [Actinomadura sp. 9N215]|uniref:CHAT domain-containing protein n=1 Tax=Actinomadura sp. 9N215 TaxID=3375150 RepID=UPI0037894110
MQGTEPFTMLNVTVVENDGVTRYRYELRTSGGTEFSALEQEYSVEVNQQLVRDLCDKIDKTLTAALSGGTDYRDTLVTCGQTLYKHLFRPVRGNEEPALLVRVRQSQSPLMVRSNELLVPWELLHDGADFLGLAHDLGRGSVVAGSPLDGRDVGSIERAVIVGDPLGDLPAARSEAEHIADWLEERGTRCKLLLGDQATLADVVNELSSTRYDLLHYCGHITIRSKPTDSGLLLHERRLLNESALLTASRVGAPPVVFVNGCRASGPISNLCVSFMTMGAKVVVGTRTDVAERSAQRFAEEFYRRLLADETAGRAMREARRSILDEPDGAWASFLLYGNPSVHITGGPHASSSRKAARRAPGRGPHSPEAAAMMDRVRSIARGRGVVTSLDLLYGLATCPELQPTLRRTMGAERLAVLVDMLNAFVLVSPVLGARSPESNGNGNGNGADVQLSDTVHAVLIKARDITAAEGRSAVTPRDIATAFAETGGGSSASVLELLGVTVRQAMSADAPPPMSADAPGDADRAVRSHRSRTPPGVGGKLFDDAGRLRADVLDEPTAKAVGAALLIAAAGGSAIGSHILLQGFGVAGSGTLRDALEAQGEAGRQAVAALFRPVPRRRDFSRRSLTALEQAQDGGAGEPAGEAAVLLALLDDEGSAARRLLDRLGVDAERLIQDLRNSEQAD